MSDLCYRSARELAALVSARKLSPIELTGAVIARIEASQPVLNAFITICADRAMDEAKQAERAVMSGKSLGPLHGIPFSVKDLVATAGVRTTYGSRIFADHVPDKDAASIQRLRAAGAILVGKTTTPEFGTSPITAAPLFGRTHNAWDQTRSAGGSSGGAGAATAAGLAPLAVATDAGGSTRIPAAANGVVGFKQSLGCIPHDSADDAFGNVAYVTPTTRTVYDTAMMLAVMAGPCAQDPNTISRRPVDFLQAAQVQGDLRTVRIGWRTRLGNQVVAHDVIAALEDAMRAFASAGAQVTPIDHPFDNPEGLWSTVMLGYRYAQYGKYLKDYRDIMCPTFVRQIEGAANTPSAAIYQSLFARTTLFHTVQSWFEDVDVIAMPTLSRTALPIDQDHFAPITIDGQVTDVCRRAWYPYTMLFNLTGHPAVTLPCGFASDGLPIGMQLAARPGEDAFLLKVAAQFEHIKPWGDLRPRLPVLDG